MFGNWNYKIYISESETSFLTAYPQLCVRRYDKTCKPL